MANTPKSSTREDAEERAAEERAASKRDARTEPASAGFGSETFTTLAGDTVNKAFVPAGMEVAPAAITPGTWPSPIDTFRATVAGIALVGLIPVGDEKTPYPTGTPLGVGKKFWLQQGYYKSATPT